MIKKSKAFKFLLGILVVAGMLAFGSAKAYEFGAETLRVGSRGADVVFVQGVVKVNADGIFGNQTKAAVEAWQANNNLVADGVVGPATKAAMNALGTTPVVTGDLCPNGMTLASNCTVAPETVVTPKEDLCPNGMTIASNCTVRPGATTPTVVTDEEADLDWSFISETEVTKDATNQHAFTIEIEADKNGGDAKIERLDLQLTPTDGQAYRAITKASLKVDGSTRASVDTDRRGDWRGTANDVIRFSGLDLIVKSGKTLEVKVILDLTDKATDGITLGKVDYRYSDGTGIISSKEVDANIAATVGEVEELSFRFTKNRATPSDTSLDTSSAQNNVVLAVTDVEVRKGVEGVVEDAQVEILFTDAVNIADVKALVSSFAIKIDGKQVDTINASSLVAGDFDTEETKGTVTLEFDLSEYEVEEGDKFDVSVLANFRKYETKDGEKAISAVKMTSLALKGYDDAADKGFAYTEAKSGVSWAALYTVTEGEIEVDIIDSSVAVGEPLGDAQEATIAFEVVVNNESGSSLNVLAAEWVFDVKGYTLKDGTGTPEVKIKSTGASAGTLNEDTEETYKVTLTYTGKVSNQAFSIEVKTIDGKSIGYIWRD